ncbi:MAG: hypothetical protein H5T44_00605 [Thermoplasmatales archaeon]|nr:hypothetical protein [Thermoplasmatales archaeon]
MSGLYTLIWIPVGLFMNILLSRRYGDAIEKKMKKFGLILLFIFVPILVFKNFLNVNFGKDEIDFIIVSVLFTLFLYLIAYLFALKKGKNELKTIVVNQGRSSAFIGGALLSIEKIAVYAAIYMSLLGIYLFAIVPYILSRGKGKGKEKNPLPFYLKIYPWYLLVYPISAVILHSYTGLTTKTMAYGEIIDFLASLTIISGLYYVGATISLKDLKISEIKKIFLKGNEHFEAVGKILFLTLFLTPLISFIILFPLVAIKFFPIEWFAVLLINSILPITSTNMFLIPYGIDGKVTALAVTWSTIFSIPIFVILFNIIVMI